MIINLRGCSGSGKTTLIHQYKTLHGGWTPLHVTPDGDISKRPVAYEMLDDGSVAIGPYETPCGGCDAIKTQDLICEAVRFYAGIVRPYPTRHVFFEGLLLSTLFERYAKLSEELGGIVFAFLDTPLDVCIARVEARRAASTRRSDKPFNPALTEAKWHLMRRLADKFGVAGHTVRWLRHEHALDDLQQILESAP